MNAVVCRLIGLGVLCGLVGCQSVLFGRQDSSERPSEVALALYVTEQANPNPQMPLETARATPAVRVELSGDSLDDVAAQLAAMTTLVEQERQKPGSVAPLATPQVPTARANATATASEPVLANGPEDATATAPVAESRASSMPGLPPTATLAVDRRTDRSADAAPRALGTYGSEDRPADTAPIGSVSLQPARPSPIAIKVIQLRDDSMLLNADFDALAADPKKALGSTYLRHDDYLLKPGQYKTASLRRLEKETAFIGGVAAYFDLDLREWKAVHRIEPTGGRYAVLMVFDESGAKIRTEDLR